MKKVLISKEATKKLQKLFCWVYKNEIQKVEDIKDGEIIEILSSDGNFLAIGYFNSKSVISIRVLSFERVEIDESFFRARIQKAVKKRESLKNNSNAYRLIHSEADFLSGLMVDYYNGYLAIQINTLGIDIFRDIIIKLLIEIVEPIGIFDKSDSKVRAKEGLKTINAPIYGDIPHEIEIDENGIKFVVNLYLGQKTGFYLDQRENRHIVSQYIKSNFEILDIFCNAGGFGLYALRNGAKVKFVDISQTSIQEVERNIALNQFKNYETIVDDAFKFLTKEISSEQKYDLIILDPPSFAKTKKETQGAIKGFKFLLSSAIKLLKPNGYIAIFSCSYHIAQNELLDISLEVAKNSKSPLEIVETLSADRDHPYILNFPHSNYLNGLLLRKESF